jgi:hypothetical protein
MLTGVPIVGTAPDNENVLISSVTLFMALPYWRSTRTNRRRLAQVKNRKRERYGPSVP